MVIADVGVARDTSWVLLDSLARVDDALARSWDRATCDPVDLGSWSADEPARGQCGVTALVVQDLLGGDLIMSEVLHADGTRQGVHYWNRLGELDVDLTRRQFTDGEQVGPGRVVTRPAGEPRRCCDQYVLLRSRVLRRLDLPTDTGPRGRYGDDAPATSLSSTV